MGTNSMDATDINATNTDATNTDATDADDTNPPLDVDTAEDIGDAQISEIVDQELAIAVADPDPVYVVYVEFEGDEYTSVHTSAAGAEARLRETAARWGIANVLEADQLVHRITKVPLETP